MRDSTDSAGETTLVAGSETTSPWLGRVVMTRDRRDVGIVVDAWPLEEPRGIVVRWEPLLSGRTSELRPLDVVRVAVRVVGS